MILYILGGRLKLGDREIQILVTEDEWENSKKPQDYVVPGTTSSLKLIGKLEVDGDTRHLSGSYTRDH